MECLLVSGTTLEGSLGQVSQVYTASGSDKFAGGVQWMMINNCTVVAVYINGEAQVVITPDAETRRFNAMFM